MGKGCGAAAKWCNITPNIQIWEGGHAVKIRVREGQPIRICVTCKDIIVIKIFLSRFGTSSHYNTDVLFLNIKFKVIVPNEIYTSLPCNTTLSKLFFSCITLDKSLYYHITSCRMDYRNIYLFIFEYQHITRKEI